MGRRSDHFSQEDVQMAKRCVERFTHLKFTSYMGNKCKSKSQWDTTSLLLAIIEKTRNNKYWRGCEKKEHLLPVGMEIGTATMENSMEVLQKVRNKVTIWPSNPSSGYLQEIFENIYS